MIHKFDAVPDWARRTIVGVLLIPLAGYLFGEFSPEQYKLLHGAYGKLIVSGDAAVLIFVMTRWFLPSRQ